MTHPRLPTDTLLALLRRAPKAELHLHIEGSLEPEMMFALAQRNGVTLPYPDVATLRRAYDFQNLQSFLDLYYAGASVLLQARDFEDLAWAYFQRARADGCVRCEIFFDPQTHTDRGVPLAFVMQGLLAAVTRARSELGLSVGLIPCFLRHLSEEAALDTLEALKPYREELLGVGLDSSELGHPPEQFAMVFAAAGALGLHRVAHAGEEGPPAYIWDALRSLHAERIDHGVRCLEDAALVAHLREAGTPLTVCPLSNVKLRVVQRLEEHCLPQLLAEGLCALVNADDPAYFGGYLMDNIEACVRAMPQLGLAEWHRLLDNSLAASFAPDTDKITWRARLAQDFAAAGFDPGAAPDAAEALSPGA